MSNILQVTDPSTYIDNRNIHTGQEQQSALNSSQIQNPSDPASEESQYNSHYNCGC